MLEFMGDHYVEMVVIAMSLFGAGLFLVSVSDAMHRRNDSQD